MNNKSDSHCSANASTAPEKISVKGILPAVMLAFFVGSTGSVVPVPEFCLMSIICGAALLLFVFEYVKVLSRNTGWDEVWLSRC
ncbi:MAG: hypothetical protein ABSA46_07275 [Thermodesulfovibrionales bacterium]|jgi:uncharacterized membrane protein YoaK (UPF0700 family)